MEKQTRLLYRFSWFPWLIIWAIGIKSFITGFEFIWVKHTGLSALITVTTLSGFVSFFLLGVIFSFHLSYLVSELKKKEIKLKKYSIIPAFILLAFSIFFITVLETDFLTLEGFFSSTVLVLLFDLIYAWPFIAWYLKYVSTRK